VLGSVRRLDSPVPGDTIVGPNEIIVAARTDRTFLPALRRSAGLITADAGADAHCRLVALQLGLPAVVGVTEGIAVFQDGMQIVMDTKRGIVYERPPALWRSEDE
jgi:pyruvate kinase